MRPQPSRDRGGLRRLLLGRVAVCGAAGIALVVLSSSRWSSAAPPAVDPPAAGASVVVASGDLPAGSVLRESMLTVASVPSSIAPGLVTDVHAVSGRQLLLPLARGQVVPAAAVSQPSSSARGDRRFLTLAVASADMAGDVGPGAIADVVASFAGAEPGTRPEVLVIATVRVVAIAAASDAPGGVGAPSDQQPPGSTSATGADMSSVTIDCASADALRVLWAHDNSRGLRLIGHPAGTGALTAVDGVSASR